MCVSHNVPLVFRTQTRDQFNTGAFLKWAKELKIEEASWLASTPSVFSLVCNHHGSPSFLKPFLVVCFKLFQSQL